MRIYGSSPLYQYVELVFRCKRMFIFAIIVGSVITSGMVYMRSVSYSATLIASLGGTDATEDLILKNVDNSPAQRKAEKLAWWIRKDPDFIPQVVKDSGVDRKVAADKQDDLIRRVRASLSNPSLANGLYMEMSIVWPEPKEAEALLNALYSKFANKIVESETVQVTAKRQLLQQQMATYEREANAKAAERVQYLAAHYWQQPALLGTAMSQLDRAESQITETRMQIGEARSRLDSITTQLSQTPPTTVIEDSVTAPPMDDTLGLKQQKDTLIGQLTALQQRYGDQHPAIVALKRQIADLDAQIQAAASKPKEKPKTNTKHEQPNPLYGQLQQMQVQMSVLVKGLERRVGDLQAEISKYTARVQQMPGEQVRFDAIDRHAKLSESVRNQTEALLASAQIDEQRDKFIKSRQVSLMVPPKAEKLDTGGKTALLYALGPMMGVIIAFCFSLLAESLDHTVRTPVEVEKHLGKPVLAVIPKMQSARDSRKRLAGARKQSITS